jgi:flagellar biosynthesis protein FlhB
MADENEDGTKTEDPTQKRLDEALNRGDVVKSHEVNTWFIIAGGTVVLFAFAHSMSADLHTTLRGIIANSHALPTDGRDLMAFAALLAARVFGILAAPFLVLILAAIAGSMIQHRLVWSVESLRPALSKISPMSGAKRMFSKQSLVNFAEGLAKLTLMSSVMVALLWPERSRLEGLITVDPAALLEIARSLVLRLLAAVVAILALVAALDYLWQYRQWFERQKMSLREVRDEFKQAEGDPAIKAKIRQIRQNRAKRRMMTKVPKASVVITNPTHYAVALHYARGMNAPICVAKGMDLMALKIREIAQTHAVPIVENPPLARALHATVEVDQEIPPEHYQAVAEVVGYVMRLNRAASR